MRNQQFYLFQGYGRNLRNPSKTSSKKLNFLLSIPVLSNIIRKKIKTQLGLNEQRICLTGAAPIAPSTLGGLIKLIFLF